MEYYMFHKPAGCVSANSDDRHRTVMDYFREVNVQGLHSVGRLDKDTEGLLFITNDGKWNQALMRPENHIEKTYFFWALGTLTDEAVKRIEEGIEIRGGIAKPGKLIIKENTIFQEVKDIAIGMRPGTRDVQPVCSGLLTIHEGKKHQVKRMIKAAGGFVVYLKRISIGGVMLDESLQPGEFRRLREEELKKLTTKTIQN